MPGATGDVTVIFSLTSLLVGGAFAAVASMFDAPELGVWLDGFIIGVVILFVCIAKLIPNEDG